MWRITAQWPRKYIQQNYRRKLSQPKEGYSYECSVYKKYTECQIDWIKKKSSHHIIIKTKNIQNKERILRAAREKGQVTFTGKLIRITPDFSIETMKARRSWIDVLQKLRDHECTPRLLYLAKFSFTINGENKIFQDKNRLKQYVSTNPAIQKVLEGKLQPKEANNIHNNTDIWQPSTSTTQRRETYKHYHQK